MELIIGIIDWVKVNWVQIVEVYLALIGAASVIVKLTPTQVDDNFVQKIKDFVAKYVALND